MPLCEATSIVLRNSEPMEQQGMNDAVVQRALNGEGKRPDGRIQHDRDLFEGAGLGQGQPASNRRDMSTHHSNGKKPRHIAFTIDCLGTLDRTAKGEGSGKGTVSGVSGVRGSYG